MSEPARRQRVRVATEQEIREHTRAVLVTRGRDGLTLRAIAAELGMTAPALYRYYGSREDLLRAVASDICTELAGELAAASAAAVGELEPADDRRVSIAAVFAACRAFRRWALAHPAEFVLAFASTDQACPSDCAAGCRCGHAQFARAFLGVGVRLLAEHGIRLPADEELPPELVAALTPYRRTVLDTVAEAGIAVTDEVVTVGAVHFFLQAWARLYGHVALEVLGQFRFALDDAEPLFESMLADLAGHLS
ncbi:MAG TPA: TetR/AcrR family transcriptional regulator [Pseudonocardiaceae bacterium]